MDDYDNNVPGLPISILTAWDSNNDCGGMGAPTDDSVCPGATNGRPAQRSQAADCVSCFFEPVNSRTPEFGVRPVAPTKING